MADTKFKKGLVPWNKGTKGISKSNKTSFKKGFVPWNKGKKGVMLTPWNKGKRGIYSQEQLKRMRESRKGKSSWIKGKHWSEEMRKKLSESHKGQIAWNKGKKTGKPSWNRGIPLSKETKIKLSQSLRGKKMPPRSEEYRRKLSESRKGKSSWSKGKHFSKEHRNRISEAKKGHFVSEEARKKISLANIGKKYPGTSEHRREIILKRLQSGEFPLQQNTKPERQLKEELLKRGYKEGIDFIHQYKFMNKFMCDFCFPRQKIIIEVHGDFWHANPKKYSDISKLHAHQIKGINRDKSKEAYITKVDNHSWIYLVFWETDIKKDVAKCVDKIEEILKEKIK